MKSYILSIAFIILLAGCSKQMDYPGEVQAVNIFSLDKNLQKLYLNQITALLDNLYWKYDKNSVAFSEETIIGKNNPNFTLLKDSCKDIELDITKYSGNTAVTANINLIHFNNDSAGTAKFYFKNDSIIGAFYNPDYDETLPVSLKNRNIYAENIEFLKYEAINETRSFTVTKNNVPIQPIYTINKNKIASIDNASAVIYKYDGKFLVDTRISFGENLLPMSLTFLEPNETNNEYYLAVLLGELEDTEPEENFDFENEQRLLSKKIVFYDQHYKKLKTEIDLNYPYYATLAFDEDSLLLGGASSLHYYKYESGNWQMFSQVPLTHAVKYFSKTDIDGSGNIKYIMTDGMDLFLYTKKNKNFSILWQTHLSRPNSFIGPIYCADLNGDGIKEVYIEDSTSTVIRYILTEHGLVSSNEDILYGERIFAGDFNENGKDSYVKVTNSELNEQYVYIAD